jgi:hypothetical protein
MAHRPFPNAGQLRASRQRSRAPHSGPRDSRTAHELDTEIALLEISLALSEAFNCDPAFIAKAEAKLARLKRQREKTAD